MQQENNNNSIVPTWKPETKAKQANPHNELQTEACEWLGAQQKFRHFSEECDLEQQVEDLEEENAVLQEKYQKQQKRHARATVILKVLAAVLALAFVLTLDAYFTEEAKNAELTAKVDRLVASAARLEERLETAQSDLRLPATLPEAILAHFDFRQEVTWIDEEDALNPLICQNVNLYGPYDKGDTYEWWVNLGCQGIEINDAATDQVLYTNRASSEWRTTIDSLQFTDFGGKIYALECHYVDPEWILSEGNAYYPTGEIRYHGFNLYGGLAVNYYGTEIPYNEGSVRSTLISKNKIFPEIGWQSKY